MSASPGGFPTAPEPSSPSGTKMTSFPVRFVDFWWVDIAAKLSAYSTPLWAAWSDGIYLTAWPRTAAILVCAVFLFGFMEGGTHWTLAGLNGYSLVGGLHAVSFAEMFPLLLLGVFLGAVSANLGLMLVLGFALGDFFWFGVPYWPWSEHLFLPRTYYFRISQLAAYLAFFFLAVWPLVATKFLVASAHRRFRESQVWKTIMMAVVLALFVYEWTYFGPMVVKSQWSCCDLVSQLDVRYFHAITAPWLMAAAVMGVITRRLLLLKGEKRDPRVMSRLYSVCGSVLAANPRMPGWLNAVIGAAVMALLLLGYAGSLARSAIIFTIVAGILLCRAYLLPRLSTWTTWSTRLTRYPVVMRLILATAVTYIVCRLILTVPDFAANRGHTTQSFGPELAAVVVGFVALLVLLPKGALSTEEEVSSGGPDTPRISMPPVAVQVIAIIALILLSTKRALAAPCEDPACCLSGDNGLAGNATAATTPSAAGAIPSSVHDRYPGLSDAFLKANPTLIDGLGAPGPMRPAPKVSHPAANLSLDDISLHAGTVLTAAASG